MTPRDGGIARTFQNVALFKGMSALDNIMAGRTLKMKRGFLWQILRVGPALNEEIEHRHRVEEIIDFLEIQAIRKVPVARLPYGLQKRVELGRALAMEPELLLLDEPMAGMNLEEKEDMSRFIIDVNDHFGTTIALIEHDMGVVMDRQRPRRGARPRRQDRRRHAGPGEEQPGRHRRVSWGGALMIVGCIASASLSRPHPEEHRGAMRLEGCGSPPNSRPSFETRASQPLLRMRSECFGRVQEA